MQCFKRGEGVRLRRRLGQHLLVDENFVERFVNAVGRCRVVYEIGCGLGSLTIPLSKVADYVFCSEIDGSIVKMLKECYSDMENIDVIRADATLLKVSASRHVVASNTPFYLSSQIISMLCKDVSLDYAVLGVQLEVGERIQASPGMPEYGRLSIIAQLCFSVEKLFIIPREAYHPKPKVDTLVVRLTPKGKVTPGEVTALESFTRVVFPYRRKKLSSGIALGYRINKEASRRILIEKGINPEKRVEEITPEEALFLSREFLGFKPKSF
ncbi:MAG: 16S rRNA (adenine(1518)-N(6)/adenine(1519)-N(6))-dimethyltransferase RsmA [Infirmifilum sp.]